MLGDNVVNMKELEPGWEHLKNLRVWQRGISR
jgi:hypothetical protein